MKNFFFKIAIICTTLFVILSFLFSKLIFLSFKDAEDIYGETFDIIEHQDGGHISTEIYACVGECASKTITTTTNGTVTGKSTDHYYIVPAFDKDEETYYICVKVDSKDRSVYNRITNETLDYLYGDTDYLGDTTIDFEGTISELDEELYGYMLEYFREAEFYDSETELRNHVLPLYLEPMNFDVSTTYIIILVVLFVLTVLFWFLTFRQGRTRRASAATNEMYMNNGVNLNGVPVNTNMPQYNADPYNTQYNTDPYNTQYNNDQYNNPNGQNNQYNNS